MSSVLPPSSQYSITLRLTCPHEPGWIARIADLIGGAGGAIHAIDLVEIDEGRSTRDYTVDCGSADQGDEIIARIRGLEMVEVHTAADDTFRMHYGGKLEVCSRSPLKNRADLSRAYTPGVARVCLDLRDQPDHSFSLTVRHNTVAVVSDGSAVLGLGNIGPVAAMPVMEGKAALFKEFGGVDAFPLCVASQDTEEIIKFCRMIEPSFGGINLEDISAPRCFEIEERLREELEIPVFHDDQHGTAIVALAGLMNALRLVGKKPSEISVVVSGAGAAGVACTQIFREYGIGDILVCDSRGLLHPGRDVRGNRTKQWLVDHTNTGCRTGSIHDALHGADVFIGVSAPGIIDGEDVRHMAQDPIIFAMSNPNPEIAPEEAQGLAAVIATGRSDYPNQINNVLAFPGIFRGALDARADDITDSMKRAAAQAIADLVSESELSPEYIIPSVFDARVCDQVARAVAEAAQHDCVSHRVDAAEVVCRDRVAVAP